jgi:serine/threonine-protein kinase
MRARPEDRLQSADAFRLALVRFQDHREAQRFADGAARRLQILRALVETRGRSASRLEAYELYGGCRFGFREALTLWADCEPARRGMIEALEVMVEFELACGQAAAAAVLLAHVETPPPALAARVAEAAKIAETERARIAELEELGEDLDVARGSRVRRLVVAALGFGWTIAPLGTALRAGDRIEDYPSLLLAPVIALILLALFTVIGRDQLRKTAVNRRIVASVALALVAQLAFAAAAPTVGIDPRSGRVALLFMWAVVIAMVAITIDRRLVWGALGFFAAFGFSAFLATSLVHVMIAMSAAYFVVTVNALAVWREGGQVRAKGL